jgi:hypothetical protein
MVSMGIEMESGPPWRRCFLKKHLVDQSITASLTENSEMARASLTDNLPGLQTAVARRAALD